MLVNPILIKVQLDQIIWSLNFIQRDLIEMDIFTNP